MTDLVPRAEDRVVDALRAQYGKKATPAELEVFAAAARHLRLSIPAREIALVPYGNVNQIQITIDGRRTIAQRTGRLRGIQGPEWCGPRRYDKDGNKLPLEWEEVWTGDGTPYAARVLVYVDGWDMPANGTAKFDEFYRSVSPVWKEKPSHMLGITAEKMALRRGFSSEIGKALADLADITGDYQTVDDDTGEIGESPAAATPRQPPPGHENHEIAEDDGTIFTCSCGERFASGGEFHKHRTMISGPKPGGGSRPGPETRPGPAPGDSPAVASAELPSAPAGPGPATYKSRKQRPVETGPPIDYYDNLPEARNMR